MMFALQFERFFRTDAPVVASVFAPIVFPPAPVILFKENSPGKVLLMIRRMIPLNRLRYEEDIKALGLNCMKLLSVAAGATTQDSARIYLWEYGMEIRAGQSIWSANSYVILRADSVHRVLVDKFNILSLLLSLLSFHFLFQGVMSWWLLGQYYQSTRIALWSNALSSAVIHSKSIGNQLWSDTCSSTEVCDQLFTCQIVLLLSECTCFFPFPLQMTSHGLNRLNWEPNGDEEDTSKMLWVCIYFLPELHDNASIVWCSVLAADPLGFVFAGSSPSVMFFCCHSFSCDQNYQSLVSVYVQVPTDTWNASLMVSWSRRTPFWWTCTNACSPSGLMTPGLRPLWPLVVVVTSQILTWKNCLIEVRLSVNELILLSFVG